MPAQRSKAVQMADHVLKVIEDGEFHAGTLPVEGRASKKRI
jgi:hypothetical protein